MLFQRILSLAAIVLLLVIPHPAHAELVTDYNISYQDKETGLYFYETQDDAGES